MLISAMLVIVGLIHLLPSIGVLGATQLARLYGIDCQEANLSILMRHRAVLFALLGVFLIYAAFNHAFQNMALIAGFASISSFIWLALVQGTYNAQLRKVLIIDLLAFACLTIAVLV